MILSVGCGNKIIPDVDVYLDLYPEDSKERKANPGKIKIPKDKKFVQGDVQNMDMFKDKEFDYVYANNVLEHVGYPEAACKELQRVAKAGLIKTPTVFGEIFFGWNYHKWLILERNGELFFFQKRLDEHKPFDDYFRKRIGKNKKYDKLIVPEIKKVFDNNKLIFDIHFEWENSFKYHVIGDII